MNWKPAYVESLLNAERATLARERIDLGQNEFVPIQPPTGGGTQIKRCKVVGFSGGNTRLSVKEVRLDGTNQEFGNAFDVWVEAFTDTAAGQNNIDLGRHKVHPFFQVGNLLWAELMPDRNWWWRGAVGFVCKEV